MLINLHRRAVDECAWMDVLRVGDGFSRRCVSPSLEGAADRLSLVASMNTVKGTENYVCRETLFIANYVISRHVEGKYRGTQRMNFYAWSKNVTRKYIYICLCIRLK